MLNVLHYWHCHTPAAIARLEVDGAGKKSSPSEVKLGPFEPPGELSIWPFFQSSGSNYLLGVD